MRNTTTHIERLAAEGNSPPAIILVNDNDPSRKMWRKNLEHYLHQREISAEIYEGRSSSDVKDALETILAKGQTPKLLITDDNILGITGTEIAQALHKGEFLEDQSKRWPQGRDLPVAVLSSAQNFGLNYDRSTKKRLFAPSHLLHAMIDPGLVNMEGYGLKNRCERFEEMLDGALNLSPAVA